MKKRSAEAASGRRSAKSGPPAAVGGVIMRLREEADLSRSALARRADVDTAALYRLETTDRMPNFMLVARLAKALGVSLDAIATAAQGAETPVPDAAAVYLDEALSRIGRAAAEITEAMGALKSRRPPARRRGRIRKAN